MSLCPLVGRVPTPPPAFCTPPLPPTRPPPAAATAEEPSSLLPIDRPPKASGVGGAQRATLDSVSLVAVRTTPTDASPCCIMPGVQNHVQVWTTRTHACTCTQPRAHVLTSIRPRVRTTQTPPQTISPKAGPVCARPHPGRHSSLCLWVLSQVQ